MYDIDRSLRTLLRLSPEATDANIQFQLNRETNESMVHIVLDFEDAFLSGVGETISEAFGNLVNESHNIVSAFDIGSLVIDLQGGGYSVTAGTITGDVKETLEDSVASCAGYWFDAVYQTC